MIRLLLTLLLFATMLFAAPVVNAITVDDYQVGTAASGIASSRHNLGSFGRVITTRTTTEICVFCHTPHFSSSAGTISPLWNKSTPVGPYTAYGITLGGTTVLDSDIGSTTLACLSCHDGVSTFDNLINMPGKGDITAGGTDRGLTFYMPDKQTFSNLFDHFDTSRGGGGGMGGGGGVNCGSMMCHASNPAIRLSLGTSLADDHPVSIVYNESVLSAGLRPLTTVISSIDLVSELDSSANPALLHNLAQNRWAVNGMISDTATVADLLRGGKVECTSCHDPHFRNLSWDEVESQWSGWNWCNDGGVGENCTDGNFLRRVGGNSGSGVCRTCHEK